MTARRIVPCARRSAGCAGECVTVRLVGQHVVIVNDGQWLVICPVCRAVRAVSEATARALPTLLVTGALANYIRQRVRAQYHTRGDAR